MNYFFKNSVIIKIGILWIVNVIVSAFVKGYAMMGLFNNAVSYSIIAAFTITGLYFTSRLLYKPLNNIIDLSTIYQKETSTLLLIKVTVTMN